MVRGTRNWTDGLWDVRIGEHKENLNMIIRKDKTKTDLAEYLRKCAFSRKIYKKLVPTAKGHLDQERSNLQSTKPNEQEINDDFEPNDNNSNKTYANTAMVYAFDPK